MNVFPSRLNIGTKEEVCARIFKFLVAPHGELEPPVEDESEEDEEEEECSSEDDTKKESGRRAASKYKLSKSIVKIPGKFKAIHVRSQGIYVSDDGIWFKIF